MRQTMPGPWKAAVTMLALLSGLWATPVRPAVAAAPGGLDPSFGAGGRVVDNFGGSSDSVNALVVQPDGKIVAAGQALYDYDHYNGSFAFALSRYNRDGSPDLSFGDRGGIGTFLPGGDAFAQAVALQPDGKIVAAGWSRALLTFALIRKHANGVLDPTFGDRGILLTQLRGADVANAVAIQPDGKIVVAGWASPSWTADANFALVRYNADGSFDPTFGSGGKVLTDFGGSASADGMVMQPDGKIVLAGRAGPHGGKGDFALARYNGDGSLDPAFGTGGKVVTDFGGEDGARSLALQPNGQIVVGGVSDAHGTEGFALARYNADGSLDAAFGSGGKVLTGSSGQTEILSAVGLEPDGKIVAAGFGSGAQYQTSDWILICYNADGSLDSGFGSEGRVQTDWGGQDEAYAMAVQPDGQIVVGGWGAGHFALARYQGR